MIDKLPKFTRGDICIVTGTDWNAIDATLKSIRDAKIPPETCMDEQGHFDVPVIRVGPGVTLEAVKPEQMERAGWVRADKG